MGGLFGGGSGGVSGQPQTGNFSVYNPAGQPAADASYQSILGNLINPAIASTAGLSYPSVLPQASQITAGMTAPSGGGVPGYGPYGATALTTDLGLFPQYANLAYPGWQTGPAAAGAAYNALAPTSAAAFNPMYGQAVSNIASNPYFSQLMAGAQQGAGIGGQEAGIISGQLPQLQGAASSLLQTGFDPQKALYNQTAQQTLDQQRAVNAMSGVGTSPYGAGVTGQTMENFNINWQNQQLARQTQALQGAGAAMTAGAGLGQTGAGLAASSAAMPANAYNAQQTAITNALNQQLAAAQTGDQALGSLTSNLSAAGQIPITALNTLQQYGSLPYTAATGQAQTALNALAQNLQIGTSQFAGLPQQTLTDLQSYLTLGQNASGIGGGLGVQAANVANQQGQGLGSLLGAGSNLLGASGGLGGLIGTPGLSTAGAVGDTFGPDFVSGSGLKGLLSSLGPAAAVP